MLTETQRELARLMECPMRRRTSDIGQCADISIKLGWPHALHINDCDKCWNAGRESPESQRMRSEVVEKVVGGVLALPRQQVSVPVLLTIARKHLPQEQAKSLLLDTALRGGVAAVQAAEDVGGSELASEVSKKIAAATPTEQIESLDPGLRWTAVAKSWEDEPEQGSLVGRGVGFVKSVTGGWLGEGESDRAILQLRQKSCFGDGMQAACPSVRTREDGKRYCGDCGCGPRKIALLDGDSKPKLARKYLECPRRRPGFSNAIGEVLVPPPADVAGYFDRVVLINLRRRPDRLVQARAQMTVEKGWPFKPAEVFEAIDGSIVPIPSGWDKSGRGAYGCMQSHRQVLEKAIQDGVESLLVLEDDLYLANDFKDSITRFLRDVPSDWDQLMLGGQHMETPRKVTNGVVQCLNTQRTHAYAIRGKFMRDLYQRWQSQIGHCDHIMGPVQKHYKVYAPDPFLIGQDSTKSDINGRVNPLNFWKPPEGGEEVVFVKDLLTPEQISKLQYRFHFGYDRDSRTGIDKGLLKLTAGGGIQFKRGLREWLKVVEWETAQLEGKVRTTIYHPDFISRLGLVREVVGDRLVEMKAEDML